MPYVGIAVRNNNREPVEIKIDVRGADSNGNVYAAEIACAARGHDQISRQLIATRLRNDVWKSTCSHYRRLVDQHYAIHGQRACREQRDSQDNKYSFFHILFLLL